MKIIEMKVEIPTVPVEVVSINVLGKQVSPGKWMYCFYPWQIKKALYLRKYYRRGARMKGKRK